MNDDVPASDSDGSGIHWKAVRNAFTEAIPAYALVRIVGVDDSGVFQVSQPNADSMTGLLINGFVDIPAGLYGQAHNEFPCAVLADLSVWTPAPGDTCGSVANSWLLDPGQTGFVFQGGATDDGLIVVADDPGMAAVVPTGLTPPLVTNVCKSGSDIIVEYSIFNLPDWTLFNKFCLKNPTGCCGSGSGSGSGGDVCCQNATLCAVFSGGSCLSGTALTLNLLEPIAFGQSDPASPWWANTPVSVSACDSAGCMVNMRVQLVVWCTQGGYFAYILFNGTPDVPGGANTTWNWNFQDALLGTVTDCTTLSLNSEAGGFFSGGGYTCWFPLADQSAIRLAVAADMTACGGSGSGSGSGSGIVTGCCPANGIPLTLFLTVTSSDGCACLAGTCALTYDAGLDAWVATISACGNSVTYNLSCFSGIWSIDYQCGDTEVSSAVTSVTCHPFHAHLNSLDVSGSCCTGHAAFTITE